MRSIILTLATLSVAALLGAPGLALAQSAQPLPYLDPSLPVEQRAADLVSRMTLQEKVAQMVNTAPAIPRLDVPAYNYWSEGLHGVARSGYATMFPQAIAMAATWDTPLEKEMGTVTSIEARAKHSEAVRQHNFGRYYGLTFWAPNINIFRDPRWGRGQETYGEDPYLTSQMGMNYVEGMQGTNPKYFRVIATPKHFAVHSGPEPIRHQFNVDPSKHDLWDTYMPAFRATLLDAKADSTMCSYNALYGKPACGSDLLLKTILRGYWNFQGFVTSDCDAVADIWEKNSHHLEPDAAHAAADAVLHGTDTDCGNSYLTLTDAVKKGLLSEADIDLSVRRLFVARMKLGMFDPPSMVPYASIPYSEVDSSAHKAAALEAAEKAMVLLKNDGILPLKAEKYKTIAVIGPNAASLAALEGNYNAIPDHPQMPIDALREALAGSHVIYEQGSPYADGITLPVPRTMLHPSAKSQEEGLKAEYFTTDSVAGSPAVTQIDPQIDFDWADANPLPGDPETGFAVRWTGVLVPPQPGKYEFTVHASYDFGVTPGTCTGDCQRYSVTLDGKQVAASSPSSSEAASNPAATFTLNATNTHPHTITIELIRKSGRVGSGIALNWLPPSSVLQENAVKAAKRADLVIAMVGLSPRLEGEEMPIHVAGFDGGDRTAIILPEPQQHMLQAVAATGKPLVVVLLNGSALAIHWADQHANAILEAWYPGQSGAKAIADTLTGKNDPGGRLPITFYASLDQLPPFTDYSMKNRTYRYFTGKPLYDFGYGLSYTKFSYSDLKLSTEKVDAGDTLTVETDVRNTGQVAGDEVAELYLLPPKDGNGGLSPNLQLEGFQRVHLEPGQSQHLTFQLHPRQLSEVDAQGARSVQAGSYTVSVGGAQPKDARAPDPVQTAAFTIVGSDELPH